MTQNGLQWVVNAYLLALASFVPIGGRLSELLGQARMFRLGALGFVAASAACGPAQSEAWIIAARGLQGLDAAVMIPRPPQPSSTRSTRPNADARRARTEGSR
jgi:MFS family permease